MTTFSLRDMFKFIAELEQVNVNESQMFSLDVTSLFTNVPLWETVDQLCEYFWWQKLDVGINLGIVKEIFIFCTKNIQFQFSNKFIDRMIELSWALTWENFWRESSWVSWRMTN